MITQSSLSLPFGRWLVDQAGHVAKRFRDAGHPVMIAVNLSQDQIETGAFIEALSATRTKYALDDPFLVAEVLEATQFHDLELAASLLQEARELGAKIASSSSAASSTWATPCSACVLAEGIETQTQLDTLSAMGCDLGQGTISANPRRRRLCSDATSPATPRPGFR